MSVIHKFEGNQQESLYKWKGVVPEPSPDPLIADYVKHVLIGPLDNAPNFIIRYFQIAPGGHSPLHQHPHEHGIVILHGLAKVQLNDKFHELSPMDAAFIPGNELHQFIALGDEPLGFICVIPKRTQK